MTTHHRGFSLVEAAISIGLVGLIVVAALQSLGTTAKLGAMRLAGASGGTLAQDLVNEALQANYEEAQDSPVFGPEPGEGGVPPNPPPADIDGPQGAPPVGSTREAFDDLDDFHGWSRSPPQSRDGYYLMQYAGWTRSCTVEKVDPTTLDPLDNQGSADTGVRRITVSVTSPTGEATTIMALRGDYRALERSPTFDHSYVSFVGIELQLAPDTETRSRAGVNILNQRPPDQEVTP